MKQFKAKPLNSAGFAHIILPLFVVLAIGGIGTYLFATSHADALVSCTISGMPKRSSTIPARPVLRVTNSGTTSFRPTVETSIVISDGLGHGAGGSTTKTYGAVAANTTRNFAISGHPGGAWGTDTVEYTVDATSTDPSFSCSATTLKTTSLEVTRLSNILTALENNTAQARVTAANVTVPGPVGDAQARPIVFTVNGVTYYAYTQGQAPDFNSTTPFGLANSMSLISITGSAPQLTSAHLDKTNNLVDANGQAVGFSTGGN